MTATDFFIDILGFLADCVDDIFEMFFSFTPVTIVLSVLIGVAVLVIVLGILRGRRM